MVVQGAVKGEVELHAKKRVDHTMRWNCTKACKEELALFCFARASLTTLSMLQSLVLCKLRPGIHRMEYMW